MGKAVKHRSGPVRSVGNTRDVHGARKMGANDGGTKSKRGVRSSATATRSTATSQPSNRQNHKSGTQRGVTTHRNTISL